MRLVTYQSNKNTFFDELATLLVSLSGFNVTIAAYTNDGKTQIPSIQDHTLYLYGRLQAIAWQPNAFMHDVKQDKWPAKLELVYIDPNDPAAQPTSNGVQFSSSAAWQMVHGLVGSMFIRYFENSKEKIEAKFGSNTSSWPERWNFARVVRNALTHRGIVEIRNPAASPVVWRGISVAPSDNGKQILSRNNLIDVADLLVLIEELDQDVT